MKKRVIAIVVICSLLIATLYGCGIIVKNNERDLNQVVATVGYNAGEADYIQRQREWDGEKKEFKYVDGKKKILKRELVTVFLNVGSQYISNYKMSIKEVFELLIDQLINREIMIQQAIRDLLKDSSLSLTLENCLTEEEITEINDTVYNEYYEQIKALKEEIDEEQGRVSASPSATASPSPTPTPRPTEAPAVSPSPSPVDREDPIPVGSDDANGAWLAAVKRFEKLLKNNEAELTKEKYQAQQIISKMESKVLENYQKDIEDRAVEEWSADGDVWKKYTDKLATLRDQQKEQYGNDASKFVSALESYDGSTYLLYNPTQGYFYVKSILVGYTDAQNAMVKNIDASALSKEEKEKRKQALLDNIIAKDLRDIVTYTKDEDVPGGETAEDVEFPDWMPYEGQKVKKTETVDGVEKITVDTDDNKNTDYLFQISNDTKGDFIVLLKKQIEELRSGKSAIGKADTAGSAVDSEKTYDKADVYNKNRTYAENAFSSLTFKYGTDPGMFNNAVDYLVGNKPDNPATTEKFVTEFADGSRDALKGFQGTVDGKTYQERTQGMSLDSYLAQKALFQLNSMRIVSTQYGWHVIMVTDALSIGNLNDLYEADKDLEGSFTYKFIETINNEIKNNEFSDKQSQILDEYMKKSGFVNYYKKTYADLLKLK